MYISYEAEADRSDAVVSKNYSPLSAALPRLVQDGPREGLGRRLAQANESFRPRHKNGNGGRPTDSVARPPLGVFTLKLLTWAA